MRRGHLWRGLAVGLIGTLAVAASAPAATSVTLVKDINPRADDGTHGREFWKAVP
jgi:hypothetical protein